MAAPITPEAYAALVQRGDRVIAAEGQGTVIDICNRQFLVLFEAGGCAWVATCAKAAG
jgi:alanine dehydrogenase